MEVDVDDLNISRFEQLSAQDYHLGTLFVPPPPPSKISTSKSGDEKGALEGLWDVSATGGKYAWDGTKYVWDAAGGKYANRLFSSGTSVLSRSSSGAEVVSPPSSAVGVGVGSPSSRLGGKLQDANPFVSQPGLKLFIQSPFDCVLAVKRDPKDRLDWLLERSRYQEAWELVGAHPEIVRSTSSSAVVDGSQPSTPSKGQSLADFFADDSSVSQHNGAIGKQTSAAEREKRRIGDLWLQQLVSASKWEEAGRIAGKVLGTSNRWEHWVWTFAQNNRFDEITPYIPSPTASGDLGQDALGVVSAALPGIVYEVVLGHYILTDRRKLKELLEVWDPGLGLYDGGSVAKAIESRLESDDDDVQEGTEDWRILTESLAKLYLADGHVKEALRCWIRAQNAEEAFRLLKEEKAMDMIAPEDSPGLLMLKVSKETMRTGSLSDLEAASEEAVQLLVQEAHHGSLMPRTVIKQLERRGPSFRPFIFFYLRALWRGAPKGEKETKGRFDRRVDEGHALVEDHADLAVELFAEYDRDLLMTFLRASSVYSYEKAAALCENRHYIPELVYVFSKTGQTKRALHLIIDQIGDVSQAIAFAKENPDLWDDLLDYSMDKPAFIRGLLEEVGTAIDPIDLVKRIPEGLEIEGLREGIKKMMREYDIQFSISEGVARVLRGEVSQGMEVLRAGRGKAVRFEVMHEPLKGAEVSVKDPPTITKDGEEVILPLPKTKAKKVETKEVKPGHCVGCGEPFHEDGMSYFSSDRLSRIADSRITEKEALIGFACGHVYHLSCLLKANPETSDPDTVSRLLSQLGGNTDDDGIYTSRSVGAKVAHAQIIKNVLRGGCQQCHILEGS